MNIKELQRLLDYLKIKRFEEEHIFWTNYKIETYICDKKERYENSGYEMPNIVYWNIRSRNETNVPVRFDKMGTALVSGFSPSILTALLSGETMNPINIMDSVIMGERYKNVTFSETK